MAQKFEVEFVNRYLNSRVETRDELISLNSQIVTIQNEFKAQVKTRRRRRKTNGQRQRQRLLVKAPRVRPCATATAIERADRGPED